MMATTVLAAQFAGALDLSETTRIGGRASQPAPIVSLPTPGAFGTDYIAADFSTSLAARLYANNRHWEYSVAYAPTLVAGNLELGFVPQPLQTGGVTIGWHDRFLRVTLSESGSYARINSAFLFQQLGGAGLAATPAPTTTPGTGMVTPAPTTTPGTTTMTPAQTMTGSGSQLAPAPSPSGVDFGSSSTLGTMTLRTGPRSSLSAGGGYAFNGGLTVAAKTFFPEAYGPVAFASVAYTISRPDSLVVAATGQYTTTSGACLTSPRDICVEHAPVSELRATVRHQLSGAMTLSVGTGVAVYLIQTPTLEEVVIQPEGAVTLSTRFGPGGASTWAISASLAPSVDIRTGLVSNRLQTSASLAEPVADRVLLVLSTSFMQSIPFPTADPFPITLLGGGLEARVRVDRQVDVGLGVQELWQNQSGYGTLLSTVGYVSVTARAETLHF